VIRNDVLFLFAPPKLFSFKFSYFLYFLIFLCEPFVRLLIDFLQVMDVLLPLGFGVIVHFEGSLRPQEVWICVMMVIS